MLSRTAVEPFRSTSGRPVHALKRLNLKTKLLRRLPDCRLRQPYIANSGARDDISKKLGRDLSAGSV
jgi:hypothetical protein